MWVRVPRLPLRGHGPTGRRHLRTVEIRVRLSVTPLEQCSPVVQRQRRLVHTQETMVRLHPGLLACPGTPIGRAAWLKPRWMRVRLRPWARPGRQSADHLGLEPGMLWVRVPPGPLETCCPRGAAWSARLPVTQEIAGSNPVEGAFDSSGAVRKSAKRPSSNLGELRVRPPPAPLRTARDDRALASPTGRNPAIPQGFAGSTPARRTQARLVRLSVQDAGPSSRKGGFDSRTGRCKT